tara:strand:- start:2883 stop:3410 length:528 start_codon:yes stop_codon:yes gene_type:complete
MVWSQAYAQKTYVLASDNQFKLEGTSTIHDWEMVSSHAEGNTEITLANGKIANIKTLLLNFPVVTLKSGKSAMDNNAYKALDEKQYPQIYFELTEVESIIDQMIKAKGNLTISGNSSMVSLEVNYQLSEDDIWFTGSIPITFTQFKLDPPKALFGTIKTGDDLKISFETIFKSKI